MPQILLPDDQAIANAAERLRVGEVVAFATETVYGLGGDTFNPAALQRIFALKGRPFDNPLIAHVLDASQAHRLTVSWDERCDRLAAKFWPGPLTFVVKKAADVPGQATANLPTIALRSPSHSVARALLEAFGSAISAPSANRSGHVSPTTAQHVAVDFADVPDLLILDGGACDVGIESTVLDLTVNPPRILRPGSVTPEQLREIVGEVDLPQIRAQAASPGTAMQHYAPRTRAELVEPASLPARLAQLRERFAVLTFDAKTVPPPHRAIAMSNNAAEYARSLYGSLREADQMNASRILIESPPQSNEIWRAIHDRLARATARQTHEA